MPNEIQVAFDQLVTAIQSDQKARDYLVVKREIKTLEGIADCKRKELGDNAQIIELLAKFVR